jgi:O-antigen ligase
VSLLVFAWMIYEFADSEARLRWLFRVYIFGCCVSLGMMVIAYVLGRDIYSPSVTRFTGGGLDQNDLAGILNIAIIMALYLVSRPALKSNVLRNVYWIFVAAAGIGVFLTGSRTGMLVLGVALVLSALTLRVKGLKAVISLIIVVCVTVYFARWLASEQLVAHLEEGTQAHSFQLRIKFWKAGLEYWAAHPLLGAGTGCSRTAIETMLGAEAGNVAHNTFVSVLIEGGLIGFVIMLAFWTLLLRMILAMPRPQRLLWLSVLVVWAISSTTLSWEYKKCTWFVYAAVMASSVFLRQHPGGVVGGARQRSSTPGEL